MEYELPIEVVKKIEEYFALKDCKENAIKFSLFEGRAVSYAKKQNKIWDEVALDVYSLYPELEKRNWHVNKTAKRTVIVVDN